jgi:hypothetical protein
MPFSQARLGFTHEEDLLAGNVSSQNLRRLELSDGADLGDAVLKRAGKVRIERAFDHDLPM